MVAAHLEDLDVLMRAEFLQDSLLAVEKVHHSQLSHKDGIWLEVIYLQTFENFLLWF